MKSILILTLVVIVGVVGYIFYSQSGVKKDEIVSRTGLHWHSELEIFVAGKKVDIPAGIGLESAIHKPMHTHDEDAPQGVIHMEFIGLTKKSDLMLGEFFKNWNKDMRSFGSNMKMTVNGTLNTEYENFVMSDGDKIKLEFE